VVHSNPRVDGGYRRQIQLRGYHRLGLLDAERGLKTLGFVVSLKNARIVLHARRPAREPRKSFPPSAVAYMKWELRVLGVD